MVADKTESSRILQVIILTVLVLAYAGLGIYLHVVLHTDIVYTHFAYIPIVLAGMWWGRWGLLVAGLLALETFVFRFYGYGVGHLWGDIARVGFFFIVSYCIGFLSDKVNRGRLLLSGSEEKYRQLIDKSLAGICVYNGDEILFANPKFCEMLGYAPENIIGKSIWSLIHEDDRRRAKQLVPNQENESFADLHYECRFLRSDNKIVWTDVATCTAKFERRPAVLINAYNITDRKDAEEKRKELSELTRKQEEQLVHSTRLAELGEMAAAVAHELNQPLTGIKNYAKNASFMIENQAGGVEEVKHNLQLIWEQVDRAAKIIGQMRELARKSEQQFAAVDINGAVRESAEFLTPQLRLSGVKLTLDLSKDLPLVMGDRIRLEQVFLNLLTNARQAMEDCSERRLKVKTYLRDGGECPVVIEVEDTGKGFAAEDAEKLFAPFFSTKKAGYGTGLGLSISLNIIKNHKGTIEATGIVGKGAKFTVRLPVPREN